MALSYCERVFKRISLLLFAARRGPPAAPVKLENCPEPSKHSPRTARTYRKNTQHAGSSIIGSVAANVDQTVMNVADYERLVLPFFVYQNVQRRILVPSNLHHSSNQTACHLVRSWRLASRCQQNIFVQHDGEFLFLHVPWVLLFDSAMSALGITQWLQRVWFGCGN